MRRLAACLLVSCAVVGCRNDIVGDPPRVDAGFEGEGEGEGEGSEGEGEGEDCSAEVPAVSIRLAEPNTFVSCVEGSVTLTDGHFTETARIVPEENDGCRHQGGFDRPGTYVVDVNVPGFQPRNITLTAVGDGTTCNDPVTANASLTLAP